VIGKLPKGITALLQREVMTSQLCVDSVVHGNRQLGIQSLLLDPLVDDLDIAEQLFDDIITANKPWLPQFWN
jgi:alpha-galactosidase/6-phospho-beta-glucosidase family protein